MIDLTFRPHSRDSLVSLQMGVCPILQDTALGRVVEMTPYLHKITLFVRCQRYHTGKQGYLGDSRGAAPSVMSQTTSGKGKGG